MIKRTSLNLDFELLNEAKGILHTNETTETIHRALEDVVRNARLQRLVARRFELSDDEREQLRTPRTAGLPPVSVGPK
jgi:Arc/MetJ family transcription regulator